MNENRGYWFLITGIVIGVILGVIFGWWISPVEYTDTAPYSLEPDMKDQYRNMIALAYQADGNIGRAQVRIALLKDEDPVNALADQSKRMVAESGMVDLGSALEKLALALRKLNPAGTPFVMPPVETPSVAENTPAENPAVETPSPSNGGETPAEDANPGVPEFTFTPRATTHSLPTIGAPFFKQESAPVCDPEQVEGLLVIEVTDPGGTPLPGMIISITWEEGSSSFVTGLYPRISPGYADFNMEAGSTYSVRVGESGDVVSGISPPECKKPNGVTYMGGWRVVFSQR